MLRDFLSEYETEILALTQRKTLDLAGSGPNSLQLSQGLPIFFRQLIAVLQLVNIPATHRKVDFLRMEQAAYAADEPAMAEASGHLNQIELAKSAGLHGAELYRLGYTLSHVVHAYGSLCQSITELATKYNVKITTSEFRDLNHCLDVAIASAVTRYAYNSDIRQMDREVQHIGSLAHELRNAINGATLAFQLIKKGTVTATGNTGMILEKSLMRFNELIDRSLTEVRIHVDPKVHLETCLLSQFVDQIISSLEGDLEIHAQELKIEIDPKIFVEADLQLLHSAISNLMQNAVKFTPKGGTIEVRAHSAGDEIVLEIQDQCGGLTTKAQANLFKPFKEINNSGHQILGMGLGLTIAERSMALNHGKIEFKNLPGKGCIFKIILPRKFKKDQVSKSTAEM